MEITALIENTAVGRGIKAQHGLSLYVQTPEHKLLIDTGSNALFIKNARRLGIDLSAVDTLIITHGHSDHGGGLKHFLAANKTAKVYVQASAFEPHYMRILGALKVNIGLDPQLKNHPQAVLVNGDLRIDGQLLLTANPSGKKCLSRFNRPLLEKRGGKLYPDAFTHEQSVVITADGKTALLCGCAHRGIANIMSDARTKTGKSADVCVGGFHLFNPVTKATSDAAALKELAAELSGHPTQYYTCHCTGKKAYQTLKAAMQDRLHYLAAGQTIRV